MITKLAVCAREVVRDAETNRLSVFTIFDGLASVSFPLLVSPFASLFILEREEGEAQTHEARFQVVLGENELIAAPTTIDFGSLKQSRQVIRLDALVITAPGIVRSKLWIGDHVQAEFSFPIEGLSRPQAHMSAGATGSVEKAEPKS